MIFSFKAPQGPSKIIRSILRRAGVVISFSLLVACQKKEETISLTVYGYNHLSTDIAFILTNGASNVVSSNSESGGSCCFSLPIRWRPGLTAQVEWSTDLEKWKKQTVPIPVYDGNSSTRIAVHFLRDNTIRVFVTHYALGHPNYPLKGEAAELTPGVTPGAPWWRDRASTDDEEKK